MDDSDIFRQILDKEVIPKLISLGFHEVRLKHIICSEVLFRKGDLWFAASWDNHDHILELDLGSLYWLRDVMPHATVLGEYGDYYPPLKSLNRGCVPDVDGVAPIAEAVSHSLEQAISNRENHPEHEAHQLSRLGNYVLRAVKEHELVKYQA